MLMPKSLTMPLEKLEPRVLLAANLRSDATLEILGTKKADTIFVTLGPNSLDTLFVNVNREQFAFALEDVTSITIQAGQSNDLVEFRALATTIDRFQIPVKIYGSGGDDTIIGPASKARVYGGTGNDRIVTGTSRDIVYGEEGNDALEGGGGNDFLSGGVGDDRLIGGLGTDVLNGDDGNDTLVTRGDRPFREDLRPFAPEFTFDVADGGGGRDSADADSIDRLISVESTFVER